MKVPLVCLQVLLCRRRMCRERCTPGHPGASNRLCEHPIESVSRHMIYPRCDNRRDGTADGSGYRSEPSTESGSAVSARARTSHRVRVDRFPRGSPLCQPWYRTRSSTRGPRRFRMTTGNCRRRSRRDGSGSTRDGVRWIRRDRGIRRAPHLDQRRGGPPPSDTRGRWCRVVGSRPTRRVGTGACVPGRPPPDRDPRRESP